MVGAKDILKGTYGSSDLCSKAGCLCPGTGPWAKGHQLDMSDGLAAIRPHPATLVYEQVGFRHDPSRNRSDWCEWRMVELPCPVWLSNQRLLQGSDRGG